MYLCSIALILSAPTGFAECIKYVGIGKPFSLQYSINHFAQSYPVFSVKCAFNGSGGFALPPYQNSSLYVPHLNRGRMIQY